MSVSNIFSGEATLEVAMTLCGACTPNLHKETVSGLMAALPVASCYECAEMLIPRNWGTSAVNLHS